MIKKIISQSFFIFLLSYQIYAQKFEIKSPNKGIVLTVKIDDGISWSVSLNEYIVIETAKVGMDFSTGQDFGVKAKLLGNNINSIFSMIYPAVPHKDAEIKDEFTELSLSFKGDYKLNFRVYNDGVAYQFIDKGKIDRNVLSEQVALTFPKDTRSFFPQEESMYSHNERLYLDKSIKEISSKEFCSLPVMFVTKKAKVLFTETALHNYPGMFLKGSGNLTMEAIFPNYVLEVVPSNRYSDRNQTIVKEGDYIAQVSGERTYPWRVFMISNDDRTFVESNLTYQLAQPTAIDNTDWIKPGKVAWDWYNANNIFGVDFKSGLNTATYKYYIDFAAANNIEYVILDEGWTKTTTEILDFNPNIDVIELISYGKSKGVELILWVLWKPLDENLNTILETYKKWGVKGIKVDFMQRNDQYMVNSYERIAKECARLELIVDFHGAFKPSGLRRKYPNIINYEGVKGAENNKWSKSITPDHNLTIPFIRMAAGPMDYTPGSMINKLEKDYVISFENPASLGTRSHQVAMYVIYEAPIQMLCESPSIYYKEQETIDFITQIPTIWDETIVLKGAVGDYIAVARRKGDKWYVGAMTDWTSRELELDLSFLNEGNYKLDIFRDGANANRNPVDYKREIKEVTRNSKIIAKMASGGGWVAIISKLGL